MASDAEGGPRPVPEQRTHRGPDHSPRLRYVASLLPTPQARDGDPNSRGASHPDRRKELDAKRGGQLDEVAVHLLPTPTASMQTEADMAQAIFSGTGGRRPAYSEAALLPTPDATHGRATTRTGPLLGGIDQLLPTPRATDATKGDPNQRGTAGDPMLPSACQPEQWDRYAAAITRWQTVTGYPVPEPTVPGTKGQPTLNPRLSEWMMGLPPGWLDVPGVSVSAQKALAGNGVVPQQAVMALRMLLGLPAEETTP